MSLRPGSGLSRNVSQTIQNQIKCVFILNVAAISATEKELLTLSGHYPDKACVWLLSHATLRNHTDQKSSVFEQIYFAKNLNAWSTNAYDYLTTKLFLRPQFSIS